MIEKPLPNQRIARNLFSYDLSGRPVTATLKKGIYIRQGRKIVVK